MHSNNLVWLWLLVVTASMTACDSDSSDDDGSFAGAAGDDSGSAGKGGAGGAMAQQGGTGTAGYGNAGGTVGGSEAGGSAGEGGGSAGEGAGSAGEGGGDDGAAGAGGEGGTPPLPGHMYGYVSTLLGDILLCAIEPATGKPTLLPDSPLEVTGFLHGVEVAHSGKFLFVLADPSRVETYPIDADGGLPAEPTWAETVDDDNPLLALTLDPQDRFAYAASPFSQAIHRFAIDAETGAFDVVGEPLLVGPGPTHRSPAYVAAHPGGHFVYVTQLPDPAAPEEDNGIRGYRVDQQTGELNELPNSPFSEGDVLGGAIVFRPDGKFLFSSGGGLNAFAVDTETGTLTLVEGSPFTDDVGSDPWARNIAVDPQGKFVYVSQFLLSQHLSGFAIDPTTGALEEVPGSPVTTSAPYSIAIEPTGRFLYVGDDSGRVPAFALNRASGAMTVIEGSPFEFGGLEPEFAFVTRP